MPDAVDVPTPFGDPVAEIPLPEAPLIAVVAQVRFPPIVSITREEFIGPFQERVRPDFPVMRQEREMRIALTPDGIKTSGDSAPVWRFADRGENPEWKLSLASSFIALDTSAYISRTDFVARLRGLLEALQETINPASSDRLGIRYVDRVELREPEDGLAQLVKPEVLGVGAIDAGRGGILTHSLCDNEFEVGDATLHARWGRIPPNTQLDPLHGDVIDCPSWLLDLDMYSTRAGDFDVDRLVAATEHFAERIYRVFRWAVLPDLLRRCGGAV